MDTQPKYSAGGSGGEKQRDVSPQLKKWLDDPNRAQMAIIERFSRLVGRVLSILESSMPEGKQLEAIKKLMENDIYEKRNDLLDFFKDYGKKSLD